MCAKRIILMYISEISGHHSATLAIEKAIKILSPDAQVLNINVFNYTNPITEKIVNRIYMGLIKRTPLIWDYLYDNPQVVTGTEKVKEAIHKFNSPKLKSLFDKFKPDAVACTQAFPCGMVADFKKSRNSGIPLMAVLTDYIPHSYWIYDTVDYYITPTDDITLRLVKKGVMPQKIKSLGIPIDPKFNDNVDRESIMQELKLDASLPAILIMGGGHGLGPINAIINSLDKVEKDFQEIIVTGVNRKLYNSLNKRISKYKKRISVLGFVDNINGLMSISQVLVTKPGGITTAEALAKRLPMVIVRPLPGQEAYNTSYLIEKQAAVRIDNLKDINLVIEDLLEDRNKLKSLSEAAGSISKPRASLDIARLLLDL